MTNSTLRVLIRRCHLSIKADVGIVLLSRHIRHNRRSLRATVSFKDGQNWHLVEHAALCDTDDNLKTVPCAMIKSMAMYLRPRLCIFVCALHATIPYNLPSSSLGYTDWHYAVTKSGPDLPAFGKAQNAWACFRCFMLAECAIIIDILYQAKGSVPLQKAGKWSVHINGSVLKESFLESTHAPQHVAIRCLDSGRFHHF